MLLAPEGALQAHESRSGTDKSGERGGMRDDLLKRAAP